MPEARRDQVHDQRLQILQPRPGEQRGRRWGHREGVRQGDPHGVDADVSQLGAKLAIQCCPCGPGPVLPSDRQRPADLHLVERGSRQLAVRADLRR